MRFVDVPDVNRNLHAIVIHSWPRLAGSYKKIMSFLELWPKVYGFYRGWDDLQP